MKEIFQVIRFVLGIVTILSSQSEGLFWNFDDRVLCSWRNYAMSVSKVNVV